MFTATKENKANPAKDEGADVLGHRLDDLKEAARHFKADAYGAASAAKDNLEDAARRTGRHAREMVDSAEDSFMGVSEALSHKIRDNPVQSSLIALCVGLVAGMLFKKR